MMQGYATTLAQAGYTVHAFDFEGHVAPHGPSMSGDVNSVGGTTRLLVEQTLGVIRTAIGQTGRRAGCAAGPLHGDGCPRARGAGG